MICLTPSEKYVQHVMSYELIQSLSYRQGDRRLSTGQATQISFHYKTITSTMLIKYFVLKETGNREKIVA